MEKYYITTPIYYINALPHIGHVYTTIVADALARKARMMGKDTYFLTGTDENGQKNVEAAQKAGKSPQEYVDTMSAKWQETFDSLGFRNNDFIRTTEERHKISVKKFIEAVWDKGDIYKGTYEGLYCVGCEAFVGEGDLVKGKCPIHRLEPKKIQEENYFFKLSEYREKLLEHISKNPKFIQPESRRKEIVSYIENFMEDISITRQSIKWGIPFPKDESHAIYVWFDALVNYLTGVGYGADDEKFAKYWPADLHLVGKDIIKFHCALWPAMLMSAELPLPKRVFAHGYFTINGQKMSKSLGNVIDPVVLAREYGMDAVRYFLLREIPFGDDGDFSEARLRERFSGELANGIGNMAARILGMTEKFFGGKVPKASVVDTEAKKKVEETWSIFEEQWEALELHNALATVWKLVSYLDKRINEDQPWVIEKEDSARLSEVMYTYLECIRHIAWMVRPIIPDAAEGIMGRLGQLNEARAQDYEDAKKWGALQTGQSVYKGDPLFPRFEK